MAKGLRICACRARVGPTVAYLCEFPAAADDILAYVFLLVRCRTKACGLVGQQGARNLGDHHASTLRQLDGDQSSIRKPVTCWNTF